MIVRQHAIHNEFMATRAPWRVPQPSWQQFQFTSIASYPCVSRGWIAAVRCWTGATGLWLAGWWNGRLSGRRQTRVLAVGESYLEPKPGSNRLTCQRRLLLGAAKRWIVRRRLKPRRHLDAWPPTIAAQPSASIRDPDRFAGRLVPRVVVPGQRFSHRAVLRWQL